jgi:hypothetical protein
MEFSNTEAFLCRPQPGFDKCRYVFFPGCQAAAIAPDTVEAGIQRSVPPGCPAAWACCWAAAAQ